MLSQLELQPGLEKTKSLFATVVETKSSEDVNPQPERLLSYWRMHKDGCGSGIVEAVNGQLKFFEKEYGDVQWYEFKPSAEELAEIERILTQDAVPHDCEVMINVSSLKDASRHVGSRK